MGLSASEFDSKPIRFLLVGILNTAFGYGVYAAMLWVGLNYAAAATVSTVVGVLFNFKTTGRLVFDSKDNRLLLKFVGVYAVLYVANIGGLAVLTRAGLSAYIAGLIMLIPAAVLGFILNKTLVFKASL
jgi:putative flippase GtrA